MGKDTKNNDKHATPPSSEPSPSSSFKSLTPRPATPLPMALYSPNGPGRRVAKRKLNFSAPKTPTRKRNNEGMIPGAPRPNEEQLWFEDSLTEETEPFPVSSPPLSPFQNQTVPDRPPSPPTPLFKYENGQPYNDIPPELPIQKPIFFGASP